MPFVDTNQLKRLQMQREYPNSRLTCHNCEEERGAYSPELARELFGNPEIKSYVCGYCGFYFEPVVVPRRRLVAPVQTTLLSALKKVGDNNSQLDGKVRLMQRVIIYLPYFASNDEETLFLRQLAELLRAHPGDDNVMIFAKDKKGNWERYETMGLTVAISSEFEQAAIGLLGPQGFKVEELKVSA